MSRSAMPKVGDRVYSDSKRAHGKITGFERDGRVRVKFTQGRGRPNTIEGTDVFHESRLKYYGKKVGVVMVRWMIGNIF